MLHLIVQFLHIFFRFILKLKNWRDCTCNVKWSSICKRECRFKMIPFKPLVDQGWWDIQDILMENWSLLVKWSCVVVNKTYPTYHMKLHGQSLFIWYILRICSISFSSLYPGTVSSWNYRFKKSQQTCLNTDCFLL